MVKTNALRLLETAGIRTEVVEYTVDEDDLSGVHVAEVIGADPDTVFKTLVCRGDKNGVCVFVIPVAAELDLKKCAAVSKNKRVEMIGVKELLGLTGYIRGGCTPVRMKKKYPTYFDETAVVFDEIYVSAGMRGMQMKVNPEALAEYVGAEFCDLTL